MLNDWNQIDQTLRISIVQQNIEWENKEANLEFIGSIVSKHSQETDLIVLPEMCTTGFSTNSRELAETVEGKTITQIKEWAIQYNIAICGSFIAKDNGNFFNRGFFITSEKNHYYDKRHLFRMGNEPASFSSGNNRLIIEHKGFNICLLICYDLRFPVWARNINNEYDLLIYVANWPASRSKVWNTLLDARALENMCYVCGVNRVGRDGNGLEYSGSSQLINAKGEKILSTELNQEDIKTVCISKQELNNFRIKFPVWKDADKFEIKK